MICKQCQLEIPDGSVFCPYCGAKVDSTVPPQAAQMPVYPNGAQTPPPYTPPYAGRWVNQKDVDDTKTLGLVALIGGIFVPLLGFICGGIGLSKIGKLKTNANATQQESLKKSKKLCVAGIIVPAVLMVISIIISIIWGVYIGKRIAREYQYNRDDYSYFDDFDSDDIEDRLEDYFDQYDIDFDN